MHLTAPSFAQRRSRYISGRVIYTVYGAALRQADAGGYLVLLGAGAEVVNAGLRVIRSGQALGVVTPLFHNGVGWLYLLAELDDLLDRIGDDPA